MSPLPFEAEQESLRPDARVQLWEIDWSPIVGDPLGTEANIRRFSSDEGWSRSRKPVLNGQVYEPIGLRAENFQSDLDQPLQRPTLVIGNPGGVLSGAIQSLGGDLANAIVTRRRIFARNLDNGDEPDPLRQWKPERYRVDRHTEDRRESVTLELTTRIDVPVSLPRRILDPHVCPWKYRDPLTCGWDPTGKTLYTRKNEVTLDPAEDECSLEHRGCWLRFADQNRQPLRIGAHDGLGRIVR